MTVPIGAFRSGQRRSPRITMRITAGVKATGYQAEVLMAEQIAWSFSATAVNGPSLSGSGVLPVDVYDKTSVLIDAGEFADVDILPNESTAVTAVVIKADQYGTAPKFITYKQDKDDANPVNLDAPVILLGATATRFPKKLTTLRFTNDTDKPVTIQILIGRNA